MIERPDKLNNQAIIFANDGDYTSAIACFKRALTIDGKNSLLWYNMGVTYRDSGDLENAVNSLKKALELDSENEEIIETISTLFLQKGEIRKSLYYSSTGLRVNDLNSHFWNLTGVAYFQSELYDDAAEYFEHAVSLNPYYEDALYNLRDTYSELKNKSGEDECARRLKELGK